MATHRLIQAARTGSGFPLFGDGQQIRDFTFVDDVVAANLLAATRAVPSGAVMNVAGGGSTRLLDLVALVGQQVGRQVDIDWQPAQPGDVERTGGSIELADHLLGWKPKIGIEEGVARQEAWHLAALPGS